MLLATGKYTYFIRWLLHPSMSNKVQQANRCLEKKKAYFPVLFALFSAVRKVAGFLICMLLMNMYVMAL